MTIDPKALLTVGEAAKRCTFSEAALRARIDRRELDTIRIGGHVFLDEKELRTKLGPLFQPTTK